MMKTQKKTDASNKWFEKRLKEVKSLTNKK